MSYGGGELVAVVVRSGFVESRHLGSVAVLDACGDLVTARGDVTSPIFPRSSNKPLQAVGLLRAGWVPAGTDHLALAGASHRGEPFHLAGVRAMLTASGLDPHCLGNPESPPLGDPCGAASRLHHNCSGKHAGMLATCVANGWPLDGYLDPAHPLQQALLAAFEEQVGPVAATGVDGCGAPVWSASLLALARAFQKMVEEPVGTAARAVGDAMRAHPDLVSGTDPHAFDTRLMRGRPGLLAKGGAEGVQALAVAGAGAVAVKIDDGAMRALHPVVLAALVTLGLDLPIDLDPVLGGGEPVGEVSAVWE